ncbi:autotransporter assembly complex protein TamA [Pseudoalteromonas aurantia]|uniref:Translocation and assembly module subunit TamA n=1 Tax=Pseudoalteromonas aurantia 208 TaxID=1314867 RepID=A0ABR9E8D0_9GAMM|nr:autotransporter assembly complex family protein [Pseudoalteromonas aurantia]MBE0367246.1 outer membrane protein [Pseudoalteromonas aurantia 208]
MLKQLLVCFLMINALLGNAANAQSGTQLQTLNIKGVDQAVEENITGFLQPFLARPFGVADYTLARKEVETALQALGYYFSEIKLQLTDEKQTLLVTINPKKRLYWHDIEISIIGDDAERDPVIQKLVSTVPLKNGAAVRHDEYQQTKAQLESTLLQRGYFDFKWAQSRLQIDKARRQANVILHINTGIRYRFGDIKVSGAPKAEQYIRNLSPFKRNSEYRTHLLSDFNLSLNATPYFSSVKVYPLLKNRHNGLVPIRIDVHEKPGNSFEVGGGYSTDLGARARFKWSKPWISEDGHFVESNLSLSQQLQDITASYTIPVGNPNDDIWRVLGGYQRQDEINDKVETTIWNIQLQRQWLTEHGWVRTAFIKREHETSKQQNTELLETEMLIPGVSYAKKQSQGGALPYWGNEQLFSIEVASGSVISSTSLLKLNWNNAWLRNYDTKHLFYGRIDLGGILVDDIKAVPFNMRYFAGGDQSVRGFAYQSIGPREDDGTLIGGKYRVTTTAEYNYQFLPNWRTAIFVDAGAVANGPLKKWSVGAGFGLRYLTPVGPIRLDHAWGLSKDSKSTRLSIVIGPEI